ncbi:alpha-galactosidase [Enterococcus timonensis]|uniref:alpha-galactosidase n=1 Tax=Enterococcus timonensis TaxID=1852364 RepID=UPI0008D9F664|nr:alpha-galactosidase [Enterococcus timonensis]
MIEVNQALEFHIKNSKVSYIFRVMEKTGILEHLYFGAAIASEKSYLYLVERELRTGNNLLTGDYTSSLEHIKQEFPVYGTTDFRYPAISVKYPAGDTISHFRYQSHRIIAGKEKISGLPQTFGKKENCETLIVQLQDQYSKLVLELFYTIFTDSASIIRSAQIKNNGSETFQIEQLASASFDLPDNDYELVHLTGAWARETHIERKQLFTGRQEISSTRGASSHIHNPFMALCRPNTTELLGEVYGFSLIYSGNFSAQVEVDTYHVSRCQIGINPFQFQWQLAPGTSFHSPEAVLTFTKKGLNGMSQNFHDLFRNHLINQKWVKKERPILVNNWEATYFDFTEEKILRLAQSAKECGIEMLVLDDGWFKGRNNDETSLGNWQVDEKKIPNGLPNLSEKIHQVGLKFGLWFEPEMISSDTPLFQKNPEYRLGQSQKNISHGRNQYVLDFSNPEVVETIFQQMAAILSTVEIEYVKWDMNRYISEAYSSFLSKEQQGEVFHRYILGVYNLYEKILTKFPDLLIESCAGGGGRFDPGLLYYAPQTWASDDTDAVERLKIQSGASMVYPLSTIGGHISAVPNHQVGRTTTLKMRGDVALFSTFGYELDLNQLNAAEKQEIAQQIQTYHKYSSLIQTGDFYQLACETNQVAWLVVSKNKQEALVGFYQILAQPNQPYVRLKLTGLAKDTSYQVNGEKLRTSSSLENIGLILNENYTDRTKEYWTRQQQHDFSSRIFHLQQMQPE